MSLSSLIKDYENNLTSSVTIRGQQSPYTEDFGQAVLLHKLDKHLKNQNLRSIAMYLAMWIREDLGPLSEKAQIIAKDNRLLYQNGKVGYPHEDGTYHWFDAK